MSATTAAAPLRVGQKWLTHAEYAAITGTRATCEGTLELQDVSRPNLAEASCDRCPLIVGAAPDDVRSTLATRELAWWQR